MANDKWVVQFYSFSNSKDYEKAKKEQETIAYIRANTNLSNMKVVAKLYVSLIEKETFDTIIGYTFLEELHQVLLTSDILTEASLPPIPVRTKDSRLVKEEAANEKIDRYKLLLEKTNYKKKISMIANFFLVIIIIVMLVLSVLTKNNVNNTTETEIINKYSSWKQELQQKEEELKEREKVLDQVQEEEQ